MSDLPEPVQQWLGKPAVVVESTIIAERESWLPFCAAVGDGNPLYWDEQQAQAYTGGVIAPPALLPSWGTERDWSPGKPSPGTRPLELHFRVKEALRLPHGIVTEVEVIWHEPVRVGDVVRAEQILREVGDEKTTRLGPGRKWTIEVIYSRRDGKLLGIQRLRFLGYRRESDPVGGVS